MTSRCNRVAFVRAGKNTKVLHPQFRCSCCRAGHTLRPEGLARHSKAPTRSRVHKTAFPSGKSQRHPFPLDQSNTLFFCPAGTHIGGKVLCLQCHRSRCLCDHRFHAGGGFVLRIVTIGRRFDKDASLAGKSPWWPDWPRHQSMTQSHQGHTLAPDKNP